MYTEHYYSAIWGTWPWPMEEHAASNSNHGICACYEIIFLEQALIKYLSIRLSTPPTNLSRLCAERANGNLTMADDSSSQIFDPRKYLNHFYSYLNKKPGEEPEVLEFILIKLHEYLKEGIEVDVCMEYCFKNLFTL